MNATYFESQLQDGKIVKRLLLTLTYDDPIACVLSSHLILERMLEIWIESYTETPNLLNNVQLSFSQKLNVCKNCELPAEIITCISKINKLRNAISHQLEKSELNNNEVHQLIELVKQVDFPSKLDNIYECSINTLNGMIKIQDASNNQRVVCCALILISSINISANKLTKQQ